jgi:Lipocalin-like domain
MHRSSILSMAAIMGLALLLPQGSAVAQPKSLKDQLVGTWTLLLADDVKADGTQVGAYGPNPIGSVIFTPDGHYALQIVRSNRPKFAANDRQKGTPDEYKAMAQGMNSHFGTYTINDADKILTMRVEGSSFPNWAGVQQKRQITAVTADVLTWTNPTPTSAASGTVRAELAWKRAK